MIFELLQIWGMPIGPLLAQASQTESMLSGFTIGFLSGLLSSLLVSWFFYRKSGRDLLNETKELKRLNELNLHALESAGIIKFNRQGDKYLGVIHERTVVDKLNMSDGSGGATLEGGADISPPLDGSEN